MTNELSGMDAGAIAFATMSDDIFSTVIEKLNQLPLALSTPDGVFEVIREHGLLSATDDDEDEDDGAPGSFMLLAIYRMADRGTKKISKIIDGFVSRVRRETEKHPNSEKLIATLRTRLEELGRLENVVTSVKATLLNAERDKLLLSGRVITDVRPVLDDDESTPSMLIINTLKLEIREGAEKRTSYISIDRQDIDNLMEQLERARKKSELIAASLKASHTIIVE